MPSLPLDLHKTSLH